MDQGDGLCWWIKGSGDNGLHFNGHNFAIEHVDYPTGAFPLRISLRNSRKMCATIIDVEIAGRRTMVSNRPDFVADQIVFASDIPGLVVDAARFQGAPAMEQPTGTFAAKIVFLKTGGKRPSRPTISPNAYRVLQEVER